MMDIRSAFEQRFSCKPALVARAPGRVNLLGEHVDYNDGVVLPAALDLAVQIAVSPTDDNRLTLKAWDVDEEVSIDLDALDAKVDVQGKPLPGWALYPAGVAWVLRQDGYLVHGMQAAYSSNVPIGSGLSSSAAVEVGFAVAWRELGGWYAGALALAQICQRAENVYVGVNCGLMDQFASACGVEGHALYFDTRSLEWYPLPVPTGTVIVIADSGVRRSLASSAYNERRAACERAVELLRHHMPNIHSLRDVSTPEFAAFSTYLPEEVRRRAEHIVKEIARVQSAVNALNRGDAQVFGALMYAGHASLRDLYEVSIPELDALVDISAWVARMPGCQAYRSWLWWLYGPSGAGCLCHRVYGKPDASLP